MNNQPTLTDIQTAHDRIRKYIHRTPLLTSVSLNKIFNTELFFKCENFQKVGAFKFRGASNAIFSLSKTDAAKGVVTHSSGNHAAALALAASNRGIHADIVMPSNAPSVKIAAVKQYGGEVTFCEPTLQARESTTEKIISKRGAVLIHPYDNYDIISGQGTAALEMLADVPTLNIILAPIGGGGLMSGTAIAAKSVDAEITVIGCEPKNADDAYKSKQVGYIVPSKNPQTIADGLKTSLGEKTFPVIRNFVDRIVLVSEEQIIEAMRYIYERMKIVIEPSSAVTLAAVMTGELNLTGKKVGLILSGGNVDLNNFFNEIKCK